MPIIGFIIEAATASSVAEVAAAAISAIAIAAILLGTKAIIRLMQEGK